MRNKNGSIVITGNEKGYNGISGEKEESKNDIFEGTLFAKTASSGFGQETGKVKFVDKLCEGFYYVMNVNDLIGLFYSKDIKIHGDGSVTFKFIINKRGGTLFIRPLSSKAKIKKTNKYSNLDIVKLGYGIEWVYLGRGKVSVSFGRYGTVGEKYFEGHCYYRTYISGGACFDIRKTKTSGEIFKNEEMKKQTLYNIQNNVGKIYLGDTVTRDLENEIGFGTRGHIINSDLLFFVS